MKLKGPGNSTSQWNRLGTIAYDKVYYNVIQDKPKMFGHIGLHLHGL